jgi:hypothetical protein
MSKTTLLQKSPVLMAGLLFGMTQGSDLLRDLSTLQMFYEKYDLIDVVNRREIADYFLRDKEILIGNMLNGKSSVYPSGLLKHVPTVCIDKLLMSGTTITALPQLLSKEYCQGRTLNLAGKNLVTVRDWAKQDWFVEVTEVDLSYNRLTEIPIPFFELFPNVRNYNFAGNDITHIDTKYISAGTSIDLRNTKVASIESKTLHLGGYILYVKDTPLIADTLTLTMYINACKQYKDWLARFSEYCCGKRDEQEWAKSSLFITQ